MRLDRVRAAGAPPSTPREPTPNEAPNPLTRSARLTLGGTWTAPPRVSTDGMTQC